MASLTTPGQSATLAQHGAAAFKWFSKLGEFVQRKTTTVSRTQPGMEATMYQETVWTPGGSRPADEAGQEPLFSGQQVRRMRELTASAPQLYGSQGRTGASSDASGSFSKDQLEAEVKRQVQAALSGQRELVEENQRLRLEVERLHRTSAMTRSSDVPTDIRDIGAPPGLSTEVCGNVGLSEGNPAGLPLQGREHGGVQGLSGHDGVLEGNPWGLLEHDGGQRVEGHSGQHGVADSNPQGRLGQDREQESQWAKGERQPMHANFQPGRLSGGNPSGLPVQGREHGGRVRFQSVGVSQGDLADVPGRDQGHSGQDHSIGGSVSGGNPAGLPVQGREHGGVFRNIMQYATGISGVTNTAEQYATGISGGPRNLLGLGTQQPQATTAGDPRRAQATSSNVKPGNSLEALVQGMTQLQEAMALQLGLQAQKPEQIRPGVAASELPKLSEADEMAAINVGDWIHGLSGPMGDLTDGSAQWWSSVLSSLEAYYKDYVAATAVRKLQLKPDDYASDMLRESKWVRVDKRAASMLLQAIPEGIKNEVLANRLQSTLAILARIMTIYRPGSAVERQQVLRALEMPSTATSPMELVEALRRWARWLKRAQDLGLQVPDASILLRGLDNASKLQLEKNNEVMFRTNMLRFGLELDSAPTVSSVVKLHSHLLAEFEQLAYRGRGQGGQLTSTPTLKAMTTLDASSSTTPKGGSSPATGGTKPCKFYASDAGCQRANCKFAHDWNSFAKDDRGDRCKGCGARGHMKKNCPVKHGEGAASRGDEGKGKRAT